MTAPKNTGPKIIEAMMQLCSAHAQLLVSRETPWNTATFSGTRYAMTLHFHGSDAVVTGEALLAVIAERDFAQTFENTFTLPRQTLVEAKALWINRQRKPGDPEADSLACEIELMVLDLCGSERAAA